MAVCKHIWDREFLKTRSTGCLNDTHKCDIVTCKLIELDLKFVHIARSIVVF